MIEIDSFLTAYDPSDLPGASLDPLGFERGYLYLADKILPGLTNVAAVPRYFSLLCAGASLRPVTAGQSIAKQREVRRSDTLRLERLWALANVLAAPKSQRPVTGLRGVRYVTLEAERLASDEDGEVDVNYKMLSRQAPYGVLGIYGAVAEELGLFADREAMVLSPDAGLRLAEAFRDETKMPASVRRAVLGEDSVSVGVLTKWGEKAHLAGPHGPVEVECLTEALRRDPVRARMCDLLAKHDGDGAEQARLSRIVAAMPVGGVDQDLREAITAILAYEEAYAWAVVGFERLLAMCRTATTPVSEAARGGDGILTKVAEEIKLVVARLEGCFQQMQTTHVGAYPEPMQDVRQFLQRLAAGSPSAVAVSDVLLSHHAEVQQGKFDRGRRKLPWIERVAGGIALTTTRVGGSEDIVAGPADVRPHFYRLATADAFRALGSNA